MEHQRLLRVSVEELPWYEDSINVYTCLDPFLLLFIFKSISKIVHSPYTGMEPDFGNGSV